MDNQRVTEVPAARERRSTAGCVSGCVPPSRASSFVLNFSISPPRRWRTLAGQKRAELDAQRARLRATRRLVDRVVECRCVEMSDCGRIASSLMESTAR